MHNINLDTSFKLQYKKILKSNSQYKIIMIYARIYFYLKNYYNFNVYLTSKKYVAYACSVKKEHNKN